jgi:SAM-dependent methyltransferase
MSVIWHDIECGRYVADLELWRSLAARHGDPVLDVGAGTGRTALDLARRGHRVTALDQDPELAAELTGRAGGLALDVVLADARAFDLGRRFPLCLMPMQTIQLLGGPEGRAGFLRCALAHLEPGGVLAVALSSELEPYEVLDGGPAPMPDVLERDGVLYASQPLAVREEPDGYVLQRRRETVDARGERSVVANEIRLDRLTASELEGEALGLGFTSARRDEISATADYVGSEVVIVGV